MSNSSIGARRPGAIHPGTRTETFLPPPALRDGVICVIHRDTRDCRLDPLQGFTYGTATPNMAIAWYWQGRPEQLRSWVPDDTSAARTPVEGPIRIVGGSTRPWIHFSDQPYNMLIAVFRPDAMRKWFDLDPQAWQDRAASLDDLDTDVPWASWARQIQAAGEPRTALPLLFEGLLTGRAGCAGAPPSPLTSTQWLDHVTTSCRTGGPAGSARTEQRRVKQQLGVSERQARKLARLESLTISAADRLLANRAHSMADLASQAAFYDQAHMSRDMRSASGFAASEAMRRGLSDESFWLIRAFYSIFFKSLVRKPLQAGLFRR